MIYVLLDDNDFYGPYFVTVAQSLDGAVEAAKQHAAPDGGLVQLDGSNDSFVTNELHGRKLRIGRRHYFVVEIEPLP